MFNPFEGIGVLVLLLLIPYILLRCIAYPFNMIGRFFDWLADKYADIVSF